MQLAYLMVQSAEPDTMFLPSGLMATLSTAFVCSARVAKQAGQSSSLLLRYAGIFMVRSAAY